MTDHEEAAGGKILHDMKRTSENSTDSVENVDQFEEIEGPRL